MNFETELKGIYGNAEITMFR